MEIKDIVTIYEEEPRAGTWLIAEGFNKDHRKILIVVKKYRKDFDTFGLIPERKYKSTGGRPVIELMLNEGQTVFLGSLLKNSDIVVAFKLKLAHAFIKAKRIIANVKAQHTDPEWIETREEGKKARLVATYAMKEYEKYAIEQGSTNANRYYCNITKMMNATLFIVEGKFKNLRELMTSRQLAISTAAEYVIDKAIQDGMRDKMYYKDIYKLVKERVQSYADLHGQSEIMSKQLLLFDKDIQDEKEITDVK